jgi:pimeloyl-ACP methyl ester carboxylesterase
MAREAAAAGHRSATRLARLAVALGWLHLTAIAVAHLTGGRAGLAGAEPVALTLLGLLGALPLVAAWASTRARVRGLRQTVARLGARDVGHLLAVVPAGTVPGLERMPAAHGTRRLMLVLLGAGIAIGAGTAAALLAGGGDGSTRAGLVLIGALGSIAALAAVATGVALGRAVDRRVAVVAWAAGRVEVPMPPAWHPILPMTAVGALLGVTVAVASWTAQVGGAADCPLADPWACAYVEVPVDHFAEPGGPSTRIAYAVWPAMEHPGDGPRPTLLFATGGPGWSGIADGDLLLGALGLDVIGTMDVVVFDARGTGRSSGRDCPRAFDAYLDEGADVVAAEALAAACPAEAGVAPDELAAYATRQVAEDVDAIRAALGLERLTVYGASYGTVVAQAYAVAHPDRVEGLLIEAPVDRSLPAHRFWAAAAHGFEEVMARTAQSCREDAACRAELRDPEGTFARLLHDVGQRRRLVRLSGPDGSTVLRVLSPAWITETAAAALYGTKGRMLLLRALAAYDAGDDRPMAHLVALGHGASVGDDAWSAFAYYATWCADVRASPTDRTDDTAAFLAAGRDAGVRDLRMTATYDTMLPCLFWPSQPAAGATVEDVPHGVPTLILTSTTDPITREADARALHRRISGSRLVVSGGGSHGTYGVGDPCVDLPVEDFLLGAGLPRLAVTACAADVMDPFVPRPPRQPRDALEAAMMFETELLNAPEYVAWRGDRPLWVSCLEGGRATIEVSDEGDVAIELVRCAWTPDVVLDGTGTIIPWIEGVSLELRGDRGELTYRRDSRGRPSVTGTWDGRSVRLTGPRPDEPS